MNDISRPDLINFPLIYARFLLMLLIRKSLNMIILLLFLSIIGCGNDGLRNVSETAPLAPQNIAVTSGVSHLLIDWTPSKGATRYNLYFSTTTGLFSTSTKISDVTSPYTLSGLTNGTNYYVAITAVNEHGESSLSLEGTGKPYKVSEALGGSSFQWIGTPTISTSGDIYVTGFTDGNFDGNIKSGTSTNLFLIKYSATGAKQWSRLLGENSYNPTWAYDVATDKAGNAYVVGSTYCNLDDNIKTGSSDYLIIKYNTDGIKQWTKLAGVANGYSLASSIAIDNNGNLYIAGTTDRNLDGVQKTGSTDLFIIKYDVNGTRLWTRLLGASNYAYTGPTKVSLDKFGNSYVTGYTNGNLDGNVLMGSSDLFLVKYDTLGNKQWTRTLGVSPTVTQANGVALDSEGNIYISGDTKGDLDGNLKNGDYDTFVIKYDKSGKKLWSRLLGASGGLTRNGGIATDKTGNIFVSGNTTVAIDSKTKTGRTDMYLVKYSSTGELLWSQLKGLTDGTVGLGHPVLSNSGNVYVSGVSNGAFGSEFYYLTNNILFLVGFDAATGSE